MVSKPHLNAKYKSKDGYPLGIRINAGEKQRFKPIDEKIHLEDWDGQQVKKSHPDHKRLNSLLDFELAKVKTYVSECRIKGIPVDIDLIFSDVKSHSFTDYLRHRAKQHKEAHQVEMYYKANRFVKELTEYAGKDIYFAEITQDFLRGYDTWLMIPEGKKKANSANTRHKKMEFLGKYWNNARQEEKVTGQNPFEIYKKTIRTTPAKKAKLTAAQVKTLEELPLKDGLVRLARDMFLFSYYTKGIRFEIVLSMPKSAIVGDRLHFTINKGGKHLSAFIHPKLRALIDHYKNDTDTIFGRISRGDIDTPEKKRQVIGSENALINKYLKIVAEMTGIKTLSFHQSRHTFAFHLKQNSDNIHVIKDSLGHARTQITEDYLKELDDEYLDETVNKLYIN